MGEDVIAMGDTGDSSGMPAAGPGPGQSRQDVLTFLAIDATGTDGAPSPAHLHDIVARAGGHVFESVPGQGEPSRVAATFYLASDAVRAALEMLGHPSPDHPVRSGGAGVPLCAALCTGSCDLRPAGTPTPLRYAVAMLDQAEPGQVLAAASTAVMAGPALPTSVVLIDRGAPSVDEAPGERTYRLVEVDASSHDQTAAVGSTLGWARRAARGPVFGRDGEVAALRRAWTSTRDGGAQLVVLSGEAGIGKSVLAADLALHVHATGGLVLYGRWDPHGTVAYQPIREALAGHMAALPPGALRKDIDALGDDAALLLPELTGRAGTGAGASRVDFDERQAFDTVAAWLRALTGRHAALLVLEDFQWADRPSVHLLDHVRHVLADRPLMILATGRGTEMAIGDVDELLGVGAGGNVLSAATHIDLDGLDDAAVDQQVAHLSGRAISPAAEPSVRWLARAAAGNPALIQAVAGSPGAATDLVAALQSARERAPLELVHLVRWRLAQLTTRAREMITTAAAIGGTFELGALADATGAPPVMLRAPLDDAVRAGLLTLGPGDGRYSFVHELVVCAIRHGEGVVRRSGAEWPQATPA